MSETGVSTQTDADRALKQKHRAMWASGDYPTLATDLIWELGPRVVAAADVRPGERVLDLAAGSGNAAIPRRFAARRSSRATSRPSCSTQAAASPPRRAPSSSGARRMPRRCRSPTTRSTWCSRRWA